MRVVRGFIGFPGRSRRLADALGTRNEVSSHLFHVSGMYVIKLTSFPLSGLGFL
jgi:hypothetical protein